MPAKYTVSDLPDDRLLRALTCAARNENAATAELAAHIAEVDARRIYRGEGCASMFAYCTEVLHMSEPAAAKRIRAARTVRLYPVVLEMLQAGELHLSGIVLLAPRLTSDNHDDLLSAASSGPEKTAAQQPSRAPR